MSPSHERPGHLATPNHLQPVQVLSEPNQPDRNLIDLLRVTALEVRLGDLLMRIDLELHLRMGDDETRRQGIMGVVVDTRGVPGELSFRRAKEDIRCTDRIKPLDPFGLLVLVWWLAEITFVQPGDRPFSPPLSINQPTQNNKADIISPSSILFYQSYQYIDNVTSTPTK